MAAGIAAGREEGKSRFAELISKLLSRGRLDDVRLAAEDADARQRLFNELRIKP